MAILYVTEYADGAYVAASHSITVLAEPALVDQVITTGASSAQSSTFQNNTRFVRLQLDTGQVNVKFGTNPTAVLSTSARLQAGQDRILGVPMGAGFKVAAINCTV